jgi:hypothetical protein
MISLNEAIPFGDYGVFIDFDVNNSYSANNDKIKSYDDAKQIADTEGKIVVNTDQGFRALSKVDMSNIFGRKFNIEIAKGRMETITRSGDLKRVADILFGKILTYPELQVLAKSIEKSESEYLKKDRVIRYNNPETGEIETEVVEPTKGDFLFGLKAGPYKEILERLAGLTYKFEEGGGVPTLLEVIGENKISKENLEKLLSEASMFDSSLKLALVFGNSWKAWIDKNIKLEREKAEKDFDSNILLNLSEDIWKNSIETLPEKSRNINKNWDLELVEEFWKRHSKLFTQEEGKEGKSDFIKQKLLEIRQIRNSSNYKKMAKEHEAETEEKINQNITTIYHDASYWLTIAPVRSLNGLDQYLLKNISREKTDLEIIARRWPVLTDEEKQLSHNELLKTCRSMHYIDAKNTSFAAESAAWGISESDYTLFEKRYISSLNIAVPFNTDKTWENNGLVGKFLKRNDTRGLYLGQYTNCCQHPNGTGKSCAWYGQESPDSGFFVIENAKGEIIAQSWTWISDDGGVCFDNCEAKGLGNNQSDVLEIYQTVAKELSHDHHIVTIGSSGDLSIQSLSNCTSALMPPSNYSGYRDSSSQKILASNPNLPKIKLSEQSVWVRGAGEDDMSKALEISKKCFGEEGQFVADGDMGLILESKNSGSVGYAILDSEKFSINDIAVLPEFRGRDSLKFVNTILAKCKSINSIWDCQARESTSYKILKLYEKRGKIVILEEEQNNTKIDNESYPYIKFEIL